MSPNQYVLDLRLNVGLDNEAFKNALATVLKVDPKTVYSVKEKVVGPDPGIMFRAHVDPTRGTFVTVARSPVMAWELAGLLAAHLKTIVASTVPPEIDRDPWFISDGTSGELKTYLIHDHLFGDEENDDLENSRKFWIPYGVSLHNALTRKD